MRFVNLFHNMCRCWKRQLSATKGVETASLKMALWGSEGHVCQRLHPSSGLVYAEFNPFTQVRPESMQEPSVSVAATHFLTGKLFKQPTATAFPHPSLGLGNLIAASLCVSISGRSQHRHRRCYKPDIPYTTPDATVKSDDGHVAPKRTAAGRGKCKVNPIKDHEGPEGGRCTLLFL